MTLQWLDGGDRELTALGQTYNYTLTAQPGRGWQTAQYWYREDLNSTLRLKTTWLQTCTAAQQLAQAWEDTHGTTDRTRSGLMRSAAARTRPNRAKLAQYERTQR